MLAIHEHMNIQGAINPADEHTRIPGLWEKLGTLYNLPILDEREDSVVNDTADESGEMGELYSPFALPKEEYGALMFDRRLDPNGSKSPTLDSMRESTVADTDEPGSSPAPGRGPGRTSRVAPKGSRASKLQKEVEKSQRSSNATSVVEDENMDNAVEDGGESEEDEEVASAEEELEEAKEKVKQKAKGVRASARSKPVRRRRKARRTLRRI